MHADASPEGSAVFLYDGVCGLCNRTVRFLLARDQAGRIRFAALQSPIGARLAARHGCNAADLDTVYVIADWQSPRERLLARSRAVLHAVSLLGGAWRVAAIAASVIPAPIADLLYRLIATNRYRLFGRFEHCPVPPPHWRRRFVDTDYADPRLRDPRLRADR